MDLGLSSLKYIGNLLSMNHSHSDENPLFKLFKLFEHPYLCRNNECHGIQIRACFWSSLRNIIYIYEKSDSKTEPSCLNVPTSK